MLPTAPIATRNAISEVFQSGRCGRSTAANSGQGLLQVTMRTTPAPEKVSVSASSFSFRLSGGLLSQSVCVVREPPVRLR